MRPRTLACLTAALIVAALGPAQATPSGHGHSYWEDAMVAVDTLFGTPLGDQEGSEDCEPVEPTGGEPGLVVYPVLNMFLINQCFVGVDTLALEGPVVLAGGLGHGRDMPDEVTITQESDGTTWEATAFECVPPAGAVDPPRVLAYPVLEMYSLDACSIVPGATWDSFTVVLRISEALG